ncbi:UDP-glycosyltransferase UGT5-like [Anopheles maculipalpis]|uniref:UDP-glycosyltransferase UGT5-like n=1 Tax=Anopheles maculipalpis TaxID=1496333 RepID=UPI002159577C|nr:UDP-glycosyltransferase UGT5-like [Anopheles maculipalpis]
MVIGSRSLVSCIALTVVVLVGTLDTTVDGAKILAVFPSISKTNYIFGQVLFEALAAKGHDVTIVSPFEVQYAYENIRQVRITGLFSHIEDYGLHANVFTKRDKSSFYGNTNLIYGTAAMADYTLGHPKLQELLKNPAETFDLLILDQVLCESLLGLAYHYGVPAIVYSAAAPNKYTNEMVGNPHNPAYNPIPSLGYSDRMHLVQRVWNTFVSICEQFNYRYLYLPSQEAVYQRYFTRRGSLPPLLDLIHNVSLVMVNSHPVINFARPFVPNMIEIGGAHIRQLEDTGFSQDVLNWVEKAKNGVIYFSMGTNIRSADFPDSLREAFVDAFGKLSQVLIIWKWENATLPDQSANVIIGPWLPQQQLLAHPNVRLHITHGGLLSMMETVHYGKPILGLPLAGDQEILVNRAVEAGYGLKLDYQNVTEEGILKAINQLLNEPEFRQAAMKASRQFREQPLKPLDKVLYYVDYVLKQDSGINYLRSGALYLSFWPRHVVDVATILVLITMIPVGLFATLIQIILRKTHQRKMKNVPSVGKPAANGKSLEKDVKKKRN